MFLIEWQLCILCTIAMCSIIEVRCLGMVSNEVNKGRRICLKFSRNLMVKLLMQF